MNRFLVGAPALLAFLTCASAPLRQPPAPQPSVQPAAAETPRPSSRKTVVRRILPHNVRLVTTEGGKVRRTASGVAIGNEKTAEGLVTYVLTNAHAVDNSDLKDAKLAVTQEKRGDVSEYPAEVVATGSVPEMDLALLRVRGVELAPAELATDDELEVGDDVVVAASPFGRALSLSGGMVSQVEWDRETKHPKMLKTDAPIGYGASGGGIYSVETGRLLAIVEGYRTAKVAFSVNEKDFSFDVPMPGETFAAPTSKVRLFLQQHGWGKLVQRDAPTDTQTAQR